MGRIVGITYPIPDKHTCPVCGKEYKKAEGLEKHIAREHPAAPDQSQA